MNKTAFYATVRARLGPLSASQVAGFEAVLAAIDGAPLSHRAYMLATPWHETATTMQPIGERGSGDKDHDGVDDWFEKYDTGALAARLGNTPAADGDGETFKGRGYVQLTGRGNYAKASLKLGVDLVSHPDRVMDPRIAGLILRRGMDEGWFTGKSNSSYLPAKGTATREQYVAARRIINGTDAAGKIEGYAQVFERALRDAGVA